ncbi:MAG: MBL fold metallo-hydrolase [Clostridiales bacterium]|nr:MBL fold metallo-hydrolase [Clostridiales bacterium]
MEKKAINIADGVWNVAPGMSAAYLVVGKDRALLVDTGTGETNILEIIREITDLPIVLVATHHHGDHLGGAGYFDRLYAHPRDIALMEDVKVYALPVEEGELFDLGGRIFEVIWLPGHTPGSIALIDRQNKLILTGDTISDGPVFMIKGDSDPDDYIKSLDRLLSMSGDIDMILGCHGKNVQDIEMVKKLKRAAVDFKAGKIKPIHQTDPMKADLYIHENGAGFISPIR